MKNEQASSQEQLYPVRREYEQIVITAPGPKMLNAVLTASEKDEEEAEDSFISVKEAGVDDELYSAFNSAVLAFTKALVKARVEPINIQLNVEMDEAENGSIVVLSATLDNDVEVKIEATMSKIKYTIVYPKHDRRSKRVAKKLENALMNILHEPLVK